MQSRWQLQSYRYSRFYLPWTKYIMNIKSCLCMCPTLGRVYCKQIVFQSLFSWYASVHDKPQVTMLYINNLIRDTYIFHPSSISAHMTGMCINQANLQCPEECVWQAGMTHTALAPPPPNGKDWLRLNLLYQWTFYPVLSYHISVSYVCD